MSRRKRDKRLKRLRRRIAKRKRAIKKRLAIPQKADGKKRQNRDDSNSVHHINPKSRLAGKDINNPNLVTRRYREHMEFHGEFSNRTPDEIIEFMVEHWFNGQWEWVQIALNKRGAE